MPIGIYKRTQHHRDILRANAGKPGKDSPHYKGNNITILHMHRVMGKAIKWENREKSILEFECTNKTNNCDWALRKGYKYARNKKNYMSLCKSCHMRYDYTKKWKDAIGNAHRGRTLPETQKKNITLGLLRHNKIKK